MKGYRSKKELVEICNDYWKREDFKLHAVDKVYCGIMYWDNINCPNRSKNPDDNKLYTCLEQKANEKI